MNKLIVANWKMNPATLADALALGKACDREGVVLCVPFPYLISIQDILKYAALGAQNVAAHMHGAFTGEVSALMLQELGCQYALVGHQERRRYFCEDEEIIAQKIGACEKAGIIPLICVRGVTELPASTVPYIVYE